MQVSCIRDVERLCNMFLIAILNNCYSIGYKSMLFKVVFIRVKIKDYRYVPF